MKAKMVYIFAALSLVFSMAAAILPASVVIAQPSDAWVANYNGTRDGNDGVSGIAVDTSGNVYVTGYSEGSGTN